MINKWWKPTHNPVADSPSKRSHKLRGLLGESFRQHYKKERLERTHASKQQSLHCWDNSHSLSKHYSFRNCRLMDKVYSSKPLMPRNRVEQQPQQTEGWKPHFKVQYSPSKPSLDKASSASLRLDRIFQGCFQSSRLSIDGLYETQMAKLKEQYPKMQQTVSTQKLQVVQLFLKKLNFFHELQYDGLLRHHETIQLFSSGDV